MQNYLVKHLLLMATVLTILLTTATTPVAQADPTVLYDTLYLFDNDLIDGGVGNAIGGATAFPTLGTLDSQVADDFTTNDDYQITRITRDFMSYFGSTPAEGVRVQFYLDINGKPEEEVYAETTLLPGEFDAIDLGELIGFQSWRLDMDLTDSNIHLPADTWWLDVQPLDIQTTGDWFWSMRSISNPLNAPIHVRDGSEEHGNNYNGLWGSTDWIELDFRGNGSLSMKIQGEQQTGDCLRLKLDRLVAGQSTEFTISNGTPGQRAILVYGLQLGETKINNIANYCATFGIKNIQQKNVIAGFNQTFGNTGQITINQFIPAPAAGLTIHFQSAQQNTCPDECISTVLTETVQ